MQLFKKLSWLPVLLIVLGNQAIAQQTEFEIILPSREDSSRYAKQLKVLDNGDFLMLGKIQEVFNSTGGHSGLPYYGNVLLKVSSEGELLNEQQFFLNKVASNHSPTSFMEVRGDHAFLSYNPNYGYQSCDGTPNFVWTTYKMGMMKVAIDHLEIEQQNDFAPDTLCALWNNSAIGFNNDSLFLVIARNDFKEEMALFHVDMNGGVVQTVELNRKLLLGGTDQSFIYNEVDSTFNALSILENSNYIGMVVVDANGRQSVLFETDYKVGFRFVMLGENYFVIMQKYDAVRKEYFIATLLYDLQGNLLKKKEFPDIIKPRDLSVTADNDILLMVNLSTFDNRLDTVGNHIRVYKIGMDLEIKGYNDFGLPYVGPVSIAYTPDTCFAILGDKGNREYDGTFNNIDSLYLLKRKLETLNKEWTSVEEHKPSNEITVFPNPANSELYVKFNETMQPYWEMNLYNSNGAQVLVRRSVGETSSSNVTIPVSFLENGMYHYSFKTQSDVVYGKILIAH